LLVGITQLEGHSQITDKWLWMADPQLTFSVKSTYKLLNANNDIGSNRVFTELWKSKTPNKARVLAWRILLNRLPTKDNLQKRGIQLPNDLGHFVL